MATHALDTSTRISSDKLKDFFSSECLSAEKSSYRRSLINLFSITSLIKTELIYEKDEKLHALLTHQYEIFKKILT